MRDTIVCLCVQIGKNVDKIEQINFILKKSRSHSNGAANVSEKVLIFFVPHVTAIPVAC